MLKQNLLRAGVQRIARLLVLPCALALAVAGCEDGRTRPPSVDVLVTNAAPSYSVLTFLRVERPEATLAYREFGRLRFDADEYTFNLESLGLSGTAEREFSWTTEVEETLDYIFVLNERTGSLRADVFAFPLLSAGSTTSQYVVLHTAATLGPVDVFLAAPGADLTTLAPIASLARGEQAPLQTTNGGSLQLSLTAQGDPATVLMRSSAVTIEDGLNLAILLVDPDGLETVSALAVSTSGTSVALVDQSTQSSLRVINAVTNRSDIDVLIDDASTPVITGLSYGLPSADVSIVPGARDITITPTGNPGVLLVDGEEQQFVVGSRYQTLVVGEPGSVLALPSLDGRRRLPDRAQMRFINGTSNFSPVEFVLTRTEFERRVRILVPDLLRNFEFPPNVYQLTVRDVSDDAILAGPIAITLAAGGLYSVLAVDHASNSNLVEVTLFDDFQ